CGCLVKGSGTRPDNRAAERTSGCSVEGRLASSMKQSTLRFNSVRGRRPARGVGPTPGKSGVAINLLRAVQDRIEFGIYNHCEIDNAKRASLFGQSAGPGRVLSVS